MLLWKHSTQTPSHQHGSHKAAKHDQGRKSSVHPRTLARVDATALDDCSVAGVNELRGRKNSLINLPSPRTRCNSVSTKKGMSVTNRISETQRIPFNVPPPRSAILC